MLHTNDQPTTAGSAPTTQHERRAAPRHSILQKCFIKPPAGGAPEDWRGIVYNISTHGVGVTLPFRLRPGTVVEIEAWEAPGARVLRARVVRVQPREYVWFCGCELLEPLTEGELRAWLVRPRSVLSEV